MGPWEEDIIQHTARISSTIVGLSLTIAEYQRWIQDLLLLKMPMFYSIIWSDIIKIFIVNLSFQIHSLMVVDVEKMTIFLKNIYTFIPEKQIRHNTTDQWCKLKTVSRTTRTYQDPFFFWIRPINDKVLTFSWCIVTYLHFLKGLQSFPKDPFSIHLYTFLIIYPWIWMNDVLRELHPLPFLQLRKTIKIGRRCFIDEEWW